MFKKWSVKHNKKMLVYIFLEFFLTGKTQASEKHCSSDYIRLPWNEILRLGIRIPKLFLRKR